jgi:hypothetical protein
VNEYEAVTWMVVTSIAAVTVARFLKFLEDVGRLDDAVRSEPKESAWDDEL